ncbi:MAG: hypothetical protein L3J51_05580 [Cocleimonas sp.]|nr:hypothetical protein [Cocleimonas sp.]
MIRNLRLRSILGNFQIEDRTIVYPKFMAQFYNFCMKQGMQAGKIVPSRAFCSDESQGLPIILMSKHFGAFPFDHGLVGGIMAHGRHAPHAHHGKDMVIIQASHVGFDPKSERFGVYRRLQTEDQEFSANCGKIDATLEWYLDEYGFAQENTLLQSVEGEVQITIDKQLFDQNYNEGLFLNLEALIEQDDETGEHVKPIEILSTSRVYPASEELIDFLKEQKCKISTDKANPIGKHLQPILFHFERNEKDFNFMLNNLHEYMPWIVTSGNPMLSAAEINVQLEFDKAYRSIVREESYHGKNLIYIAGLNIDYSPEEDEKFPPSQFVPWAAYIQKTDGSHIILEQDELYDALMACSDVNSDEIDLDDMITD